MNAHDVLDTCRDRFILVTRVEEENVHLDPLFPDEHPLTDDLITLVREHKPGILQWLAYQEQADALLLQSTRRLAAAWPEGCVLCGTEWKAFEERLRECYWSGDPDMLYACLFDREQFALDYFVRYRKQVPHE